MKTNPIAPPSKLLDKWCKDLTLLNLRDIATQAAQWGADQELDACDEWLFQDGYDVTSARLRAARRPKLLSDKEQALNALSLIMSRQKGMFDGKPFETIRKALEALPND